MQRIDDVAAKLSIPGDALMHFGPHIAKVDPQAVADSRKSDAPRKLILVTAITPTKAGEGKTTTSIGLADAMSRLGDDVCLALREPSLGPCMGVKGGGTGGGAAQLAPSDRINLHFTGDFHAITSAHNLIAALIDNHIHFGTDLAIDSRRVLWKRVLDMNDRALRNIVLGMGGLGDGVPRQGGFDITAASELMAMLCLATDTEDLRARVDRTLIGFTRERKPIVAGQLGSSGAVLALLRDAMLPNLAQTREGTPAFVHGGPFANIAHGCNSIIATRTALSAAEWVVTEAGFGSDLGAEKFLDIKCRIADLEVAAVVMVASVRALKLHGGRKWGDLDSSDPVAVRAGLPNLARHCENVRAFGLEPVVALNRFGSDTDDEIAVVRRHCEEHRIAFAEAQHFARGGEGAIELAEAVKAVAEPRKPTFMYQLDQSVESKIRAVAWKVYGARDVVFTGTAERDLRMIRGLGYDDLPVCIAKTPASLSDDPKLVGRPTDFDITVRNIQINAGAGFLVVLTGDILRMPGLPRKPRSEEIDLVGDEIRNLR
jgi:formate--tetrahydrofolate ligase